MTSPSTVPILQTNSRMSLFSAVLALRRCGDGHEQRSIAALQLGGPEDVELPLLEVESGVQYPRRRLPVGGRFRGLLPAVEGEALEPHQLLVVIDVIHGKADAVVVPLLHAGL